MAITSPEDQKVTFVELFFDLVFVFSVTQIVKLLNEGHDWIAVGQSILIFWLVWWTWSQLTWSLNAADTTHPLVELSILITTGVALFVAVAVPEAFGDRSLLFAVSYALVRTMGLTLQFFVSLENPSLRQALRTWIVLSTGGLSAVLIGGIIGGAAQYWLWGLAILLDIIAAGVSVQAKDWDIHPEHFAERHGLFVIIAIGETLTVVAVGVADAIWTSQLLLVAVLSVAVTGGLWWSYFARAKPALERALASNPGSKRSMIARDSYSFIHFLMLAGVIAYATSMEAILVHAAEPLPPAATLAFALGITLFVGGMAIALWRATGALALTRVVPMVVMAIAIVLAIGMSTVLVLAIALTGLVTIGVLEQRVRSPF